MDRAAAVTAARRLLANAESVIKGKRHALEAAATALFAGGHLLIEDVPGVGKTMLGRTISRSIRGSFKRIQATPDLLPADITGTSIYRQEGQEFQFVPGPLFANVVLVDEINRTTPRTQSALLEAMDENAVTVDGVRHPLPDPMFVVATQNPLEHHGTYPLPEGQLDRFALAISMGYVDRPTEREVIKNQLEQHPIDELDAVLGPEEVVAIRNIVRTTHVSDAVLDYALAIVGGTRDHDDLELGASPRASISLVRCAQARALLHARDFVVPDDVKSLAVATLAHRTVPVGGLRMEQGRASARAVAEIVESTSVPVTGPPPPP